ncbi:hypothetical protein [Lysobacter capsici]|uniref:hypothetical protein n=1 Tax=Lysobacter capsici TaxID=435897 RepID=UPI00287B7AED|nr:hypothetical protein [Lysobacter capsici]WND78783.1 hypothetical protein RJ610_15905 [Lysobacter capsici]WND83978.1 hypothetical protein RJ609_15915 [Lysobacter capsici]
MIIERLFSANFEFKVEQELTRSDAKRLFYPGAVETGGQDGLTVRVDPNNGDPWTGVFAPGKLGANCITGIFSAPNPLEICVVSSGQAYLIDVISPRRYSVLPVIPVTAVRSSEKHKILIFSDHTQLLAIDASGVAWQTERLSWDSFRITSIDDDVIRGVFWDIQSESEQGFEVDLATGAHVGGVKLPV